MKVLYALESIRTPWLDTVMAAITHLGEETVFMVAALFVFWCVSKRHGYYLLAVGFAGTVLNQFLKLLFRQDSTRQLMEKVFAGNGNFQREDTGRERP